MVSQSLSRLSVGLTLLMFIVGLLISAAMVSGDDYGRVNLLHFILLFVLWPLLSCGLLIFTLLPTASPKSLSLRFSLALPIWPREWLISVQQLKQQQLLTPWLKLQSQKLSLAFSGGCLFAFIFVLLFSDVSFVWRSTLLTAEHIYPVLAAIAMPWTYLDIALPTKEVLELTQEQRINHDNLTSSVDYGQWWQFLLAAQLCYAIIPRLIALCWLSLTFSKAHKAQQQTVTTPAPLLNPQPAKPQLTNASSERPLFDSFNLVCWSQVPDALLMQVKDKFPPADNLFHVGFHGSETDEEKARADDKEQLVIVAAWEPPMGELKDFLLQGRGVIMPIDFKEEQWQSISPHYLDEWRRFCHPLENWTLFVDKELT
ncbi:DUF2868 domain-containing protein [Psychrobium sp. 1_MG-2023]|uniref:DUF2868 domain-containing protein n=1 Tax=Psychrobium sp. 1_MG-2023 TaxID=3062624 RepID=UPI000C33D0A7|nr:DUF2868 domain-containing protein [Psychrobium sp. 1_MG-2023]MDP2562260.1 DUF2868 domain-containing protein [Psychrobium sp. 1_MG-2023]PKF57510.1 DUF2868 domain-containing protein [Alteromonadales bacterium alter-6D02]